LKNRGSILLSRPDTLDAGTISVRAFEANSIRGEIVTFCMVGESVTLSTVTLDDASRRTSAIDRAGAKLEVEVEVVKEVEEVEEADLGPDGMWPDPTSTERGITAGFRFKDETTGSPTVASTPSADAFLSGVMAWRGVF